MTYVCGIDSSLTAAGVAAIAHPTIAATPNVPRVVVVGEGGHDADTPAVTALRIKRQRMKILRAMPSKTQLVVIEGLGWPNPKAPGRFRERAILIGMLEEFFAERRIPFVEVAAKTVKLWATGDGDAKKTDVHSAMVTMWPRANLWTPTGQMNDNASDSLALATIGAMRLGWIDPELPCHWNPNVNWPKETAHV